MKSQLTKIQQAALIWIYRAQKQGERLFPETCNGTGGLDIHLTKILPCGARDFKFKRVGVVAVRKLQKLGLVKRVGDVSEHTEIPYRGYARYNMQSWEIEITEDGKSLAQQLIKEAEK